MTIAKSLPLVSLPDHTQLPESDGTFVKNFQEHPQSLLLTSSIIPTLDRLRPDGHYAIIYGASEAIGQDSGIYWRLMRWLAEIPAEPIGHLKEPNRNLREPIEHLSKWEKRNGEPIDLLQNYEI